MMCLHSSKNYQLQLPSVHIQSSWQPIQKVGIIVQHFWIRKYPWHAFFFSHGVTPVDTFLCTFCDTMFSFFFCSTLYFYCVCIFWISEQFVKCSSWPWTGQYRQGVLNCIDQGPPPTIGGQDSQWLIASLMISSEEFFRSIFINSYFFFLFSLGYRMHIWTKCSVLLSEIFAHAAPSCVCVFFAAIQTESKGWWRDWLKGRTSERRSIHWNMTS